MEVAQKPEDSPGLLPTTLGYGLLTSSASTSFEESDEVFNNDLIN